MGPDLDRARLAAGERLTLCNVAATALSRRPPLRRSGAALTGLFSDLGLVASSSVLASALVPEDETCFALFVADSADKIQLVIEGAGLLYRHAVEAVQIGGEDESAA
jgi:hypothetical protein